MADVELKKISELSTLPTNAITSDLLLIERSGQGYKSDTVKFLMPSGMITPYAGSSAPTGWLLCTGQAVSRTTYSELFSVIGTSFGAGDGSTTFNIPDLRGRAPFGVGTSANTNPDTDAGTHVADTWVLGKGKNDRTQGHIHRNTPDATIQSVVISSSGTNLFTNAIGAGTSVNNWPLTDLPSNDGTNGVPRTGTTTRVKGVGVNYIIKI